MNRLTAEACVGNESEIRAETTAILKSVAYELAVPVIAVSQVGRSVESRRNKCPLLCDLNGSDAADVVIFLYRDEYYFPETKRRGEAELIIARHRNGPTGAVELLYQSSTSKFSNKIYGADDGC
jgi:replicative DNA helicase